MATITPIPALPTAPSRGQSPDTFISVADAWVAALPSWTTSANLIASQVNAVGAAADASATAAAASAAASLASANNAAGSASTALNSPGTQATSITSLALSSGSKSLTLQQTGKAFSVGQWIYLTDQTNPSINWMQGSVTAFNSGAGTMTVAITRVGGSGTLAAWYVMPGIPSIGVTAVDSAANNVFTGTNTFSNSVTFNGNMSVSQNFGASAVVAASGSNGRATFTSGDAGPALLSLLRSGLYGINLGLETDNSVTLGGWSAGTTQRWNSDTSGNFRIPGVSLAKSFNLDVLSNVGSEATPTYGLGRASSDIYGLGGNTTVLNGNFGMRLRTSGAIIDMKWATVDINVPVVGTYFTATGHYRMTGNNGIYNTTYGNTFYTVGANNWISNTAGSNQGQISLAGAGVVKAALYWDSNGFGLVNDTGGWSVKANYGGSYGGTLYGTWALGNATMGTCDVTTLYMRDNMYVLDAAGTGWNLVINRNGGSPLITALSGTFSNWLNTGRVIAGYDSGLGGSVNCNNWFRSNGATGWANDTYGGTVYQSDSNFVRTNKGFMSDGGNITSHTDSATGYPAFVMRNRTGSGSTHTYGAILWDAYRDVSDPSYVAGITVSGANPAGNAAIMEFRLQSNAAGGLPSTVTQLDNVGGLSTAGRLYGNGVAQTGNGLGTITVTTTTTPSGGAQGDLWMVY